MKLTSNDYFLKQLLRGWPFVTSFIGLLQFAQEEMMMIRYCGKVVMSFSGIIYY